jgi:hypothetical protein
MDHKRASSDLFARLAQSRTTIFEVDDLPKQLRMFVAQGMRTYLFEGKAVQQQKLLNLKRIQHALSIELIF